MYAEGNGVPKNDTTAVSWYKKAADKGLAEAQASLGLMYRQGRGVAQNDKKALTWFEKAAKQGEAVAQFNLADHYYRGMGVLQDMVKCYSWLMLSAESGNVEAAQALPQVESTLTPSQVSMAKVQAKKYRKAYSQ